MGTDYEALSKSFGLQPPTASIEPRYTPPDDTQSPSIQPKGWWTPDRVNQAVTHLQDNAGLSPLGAQGLVSRWVNVEATDGPNAVNPESGAYGIAQWLGTRKRGVPPDFQGQLNHATNELNSSERRAAQRLRNAQTPEDAAIGATMFERAAGYDPTTGRDNYTDATLRGMGRIRTIARRGQRTDYNALSQSLLGPTDTATDQPSGGTDYNALADQFGLNKIETPSTPQTTAPTGTPPSPTFVAPVLQPQTNLPVDPVTAAYAASQAAQKAAYDNPTPANKAAADQAQQQFYAVRESQQVDPATQRYIPGTAGTPQQVQPPPTGITTSPLAQTPPAVQSPPTQAITPPAGQRGVQRPVLPQKQAVSAQPQLQSAEPIVSNETYDEQGNLLPATQPTQPTSNLHSEVVSTKDAGNTIAETFDIPSNIKTLPEANKYVETQLRAKYGDVNIPANFTITGWKPDGHHGAAVDYNTLKSIGVDTDALLQQKVIQKRTEDPTLNLNPAPLDAVVGTKQIKQANENLPLGDYISALEGGVIGGVGRIAGTLGGIASFINDLSPTKGESIAENLLKGGVTDENGKPVSLYKVNEGDLIGTMRDIYDNTQAVQQGTRVLNSKGEENWPSMLVQIAGGTPGDLGRLAVLSTLPGGMVTAMAIDSAALERMHTNDPNALLKAAGKGALIGAVFGAAGPAGKGLTTATGTLLNRAVAPIVTTGFELGTIGAGTVAVGTAFGDPLKENLRSAFVNSIFHLISTRSKKEGDGTVYRAQDENGNVVAAKVESDGKIVSVDPEKPANVEMLLPTMNQAERRATATVPETGGEQPGQQYTSQLDEIRQTKSDTTKKIQALFPDANLTRQEAAELRRQAWGDQTPTETPRPVEPVAENANTVNNETTNAEVQPQPAQVAETPLVQDQPAQVPDAVPVETPRHIGPVEGIAKVPVGSLSLDPDRFQYKVNKDAKGSTGSLEGVQTWNNHFAGLIQVWHDPSDGKTYVVNGHNRFNKATELGQKSINVQYIDAPDAQSARAIGAKANIADGNGTPLDAAQFLRDSGETVADLRKQGIPLNNDIARKGVALSKLTDHVFDAVRRGELPEEQGISIGTKIENPDVQIQAASALTRAGEKKALSKGVADEIVDAVNSAPRKTESERTLFGDFDTDKSLFAERAQAAAAIKRRLSEDRSLFGTAARKSERLAEGGTNVDVAQAKELRDSADEALGVFDKLKNRSGVISDILDANAQAIADGKAPAVVAKESYGQIRKAVKDALGGSSEARSEPSNVTSESSDTKTGEQDVAERKGPPSVPEGPQTREPAKVNQPATPTEIKRQAWQNKVEQKLNEVAKDDAQRQALLDGRDLDKQEIWQLKDFYKELEIQQQGGIKRTPMGDVPVSPKPKTVLAIANSPKSIEERAGELYEIANPSSGNESTRNAETTGNADINKGSEAAPKGNEQRQSDTTRETDQQRTAATTEPGTERPATVAAAGKSAADSTAEGPRGEASAAERAANAEAAGDLTAEPQTVTHPNPEIDGKPILAQTESGKVVVANPENKSGVSVVTDRTPEPTTAETPSKTAEVINNWRENYGKDNTLAIDKDAAAKEAQKLRDLLGKDPTLFGSGLGGVDPEVLKSLLKLGAYHVEAGARTLAAFTDAMVGDVGEAVRKHANDLYDLVKKDSEEPITISDTKAEQTASESAPERGTSKVAKMLQQKAIEEGVATQFDRTSEFDRATVDDQAARVAKLIANEPDRMQRIIDGTEQLPKEINPSSFVAGVDEYSRSLPIEERNQLTYDLTNSEAVQGAISKSAQTLRFAQEIEPDSATRMLREVQKTRRDQITQTLKGRDIETAIREEARILAKQMKGARSEAVRATSKRQVWSDFIANLEC